MIRRAVSECRPRPAGAIVVAAVIAWGGVTSAAVRTNPLAMATPAGQTVENCADPTVIRGRGGDDAWYMYCTADALGDWDKDAAGNYHYHLIPMFSSTDLVHGMYRGDAFSARPSWAEPGSYLWAPEIQYLKGKYRLYYAVTDVRRTISGEYPCSSDSAIGVATSGSPTGPFTHESSPVVFPRRNGSGCDFYATIDPDVVTDDAGDNWIYYGSFYGGIEARSLSADGTTSDPASATRVAFPDRYEAAEVVHKDGYYYLLASVATCCDGPLSGYAVVAGRATGPAGPFIDRSGVPLNAARPGGTPVLAATGNRWIGPGHDTVLTDLVGQYWTIYHAIDAGDPYFEGAVGYTRRPAMLDPVDWVNGWPTVRGGWWVSDCLQPTPVAMVGGTPEYGTTYRTDDGPEVSLPSFSDEFDGPGLGPQWTWIRQPASGWALEGGALRWETQAAEIYQDDNSASVLVEPAPDGDWIAETRVWSSVPASGCCYNFVQAGLVIYGDDDNYQKLVHVSIWSNRMTEWAKEVGPVPAGYPRYGKSWVGPPGDPTWLRIVKRSVYGGELYTAYTSADGLDWTRGTTWRHSLGSGSRIGLVAMNAAGFTARFDYLRVYRRLGDDCSDPTRADPCDGDADGTGDTCDPDDDNDGVPDPADCASLDSAEGRPGEVTGLALHGASETTLAWGPLPTADFYDVTRGLLSSLAPARYGACFSDDQLVTTVADPSSPPVGDGFAYFVRGVDAGCGGPGSYGLDGAGTDRINTDPAACP